MLSRFCRSSLFSHPSRSYQSACGLSSDILEMFKERPGYREAYCQGHVRANLLYSFPSVLIQQTFVVLFDEKNQVQTLRLLNNDCFTIDALLKASSAVREGYLSNVVGNHDRVQTLCKLSDYPLKADPFLDQLDDLEAKYTRTPFGAL